MKNLLLLNTVKRKRALLTVLGLLGLATLNCATTHADTANFPLSQPIATQPTTPVKDSKAFTEAHSEFAFIAVLGVGKNTTSAIVTTWADGSHPTIRYQVKGMILSLNATYDGKALVFTQQTTSYPLIYTLSLTDNTLRLLTPYRANNISGTLSADNQKLLFSSDLTLNADNTDIYLKDLKKNHLSRITSDPMSDITPVWSADGRGFIFTSDRTGNNHPQIYRYDFATQRTQPLTFSGYHVNGNLSADGHFLTLLSSPRQGALLNLATGTFYPINNVGLDEAPTISPDGKYLVYSTGKNLAVVTVDKLPDSQPTLIGIPLDTIKQALVINDPSAQLKIRRPVWVMFPH